MVFSKLTTISVLITLLLISPTLVHAEEEAPDEPVTSGQAVIEKSSQSDQGTNIHQYSTVNVEAVAGAMVNLLTSKNKKVVKNSAIESSTRFMADLMIEPPVHTATYVADVMNNLGVAQPAYAQGIGFSTLNPVLRIWKAFRNLSYFLFIIAFVAIGFMIMFRQKVGHQSIVTVQEALPRIIVTLLLITFSYAIAGFVVDMIYLSVFVITALFQQYGILASASDARNAIFGYSILRLGVSFLAGTGELGGSAAQSVTSMIDAAFSVSWLHWLTNSIVYLIIAVAIVIAVFKTLFALIGAYVSIILSVIFAPLSLIQNVMPESEAFKKWFQGLIANAAVFPAAALMIILGAVLGGTGANTADWGGNTLGIAPTDDYIGWMNAFNDQGKGFIPPLISTGTDATGANAIRAIIGLGIIMMLPEVVKMVHAALEYKDTGYGETALKNFQAGDFISGSAKMIGSTALSGISQSFWSSQYANFLSNAAKRRAAADLAKRQQANNNSKIQRYLNKPVKSGTGATQEVGASPSVNANKTRVNPPTS